MHFSPLSLVYDARWEWWGFKIFYHTEKWIEGLSISNF